MSGVDGGQLLAWYDANRRDLPWRRTHDPYAVWVSEIMLQQTQVVTVIPYWERWMYRYPTVESLALADEQEVLSLWQGLGYYRRCRLLLQGARWVAEHGLPNSAEGWRAVPGIGRYTAGAIASIAQGVPAPLVDGNVERVYARLTGDDSTGKELHEAAWTWAKLNLFSERPGDWNQALMELGATVCKPNQPNCRECPMGSHCVAFQSWRVDDLPTKVPKVKTVALRHVVWVPIFDGLFGLRQIPGGQWWEGMWEFPRVESTGALEEPALRELIREGWPQSVGTIRHAVTHHRIQIDVSFIRCESKAGNLRWVNRVELDSVPMPAPQRKILQMVLKNLGL